MKRRILFALCIALLAGTLSLTAQAAQIPDYDRLGSISVTLTYRDETVPGGTLTLYRVADVYADNGDHSFVYTEEFALCRIPLDDLTKSDIPTELAKIAKEQSLQGVTMTVDSGGKVTFRELTLGLYLLVQQETAPGYKELSPFLVSVPGESGGVYVYDVDASPKLSLEPAPTEPTTPTTQPTIPPNIPQTGQDKWQVPALAIGGLFLLGLGMTLCRSGRKKAYEK